MAVELEKVSGSLKQSIARVELFTDAALLPDDWRFVIHFEDGTYGADGKLLGSTRFGTRRVEARFGDIKNDVIANGITVAQVAGLIQIEAYALRAKQINDEANKPTE